MKYTDAFINKVKDVYPDSPQIIEAAENGDEVLGEYLRDNSQFVLTPQMIMSVPDNQLTIIAKDVQRRIDLYNEYNRGDCYSQAELENAMCPILYLQNKYPYKKYDYEHKICNFSSPVGNFKVCKNWNSRKRCWAKFHELERSEK